MDRLVIISTILVGIIIMSIASLLHLKDTSEIFAELILLAEESCINEDIINLTTHTKAMSNLINDRHSLLSLYISHEEIEKIESTIIVLESYVSLRAYEGALACLKQLYFTTNHLYERELLNLDNIF